jgi:hypothetical protein
MRLVERRLEVVREAGGSLSSNGKTKKQQNVTVEEGSNLKSKSPSSTHPRD